MHHYTYYLIMYSIHNEQSLAKTKVAIGRYTKGRLLHDFFGYLSAHQ